MGSGQVGQNTAAGRPGQETDAQHGFEVLPAATGQQSLTFRAGVFSANTTVIHHDVTPWNNFAYLRYGVSATPVPAGTPLTWLALALLLSCTAASQRHRLRPGPF